MLEAGGEFEVAAVANPADRYTLLAVRRPDVRVAGNYGSRPVLRGGGWSYRVKGVADAVVNPVGRPRTDERPAEFLISFGGVDRRPSVRVRLADP